MQPGFFDHDIVHSKLDRLNDPLLKFDEIVNWEGFRLTLEEIRPQKDKRRGGRPPLDVVLMFKMIFLRHYYDLSLKQVEFQVLDRLSFRRFLGLSLEDPVPDTNTVWVYEERLIAHDLIKPLFVDLMIQIENAGYSARGGQIVDATIVEAPKRQRRKDDDDDDGNQTPAQRRQQEPDARWTKKHGHSFYGYKDHLAVDHRHKLIRGFEITAANKHDGHLLAEVLDPNNTSGDVWADTAYRSQENEAMLARRGYRSQINRPKPRHKAMPKHTDKANRKKSSVRARVEHVCGGVKPGNLKHVVRCVGIDRATLRMGMKNIGYNIQRFGFLLNHTPSVYRMG